MKNATTFLCKKKSFDDIISKIKTSQYLVEVNEWIYDYSIGTKVRKWQLDNLYEFAKENNIDISHLIERRPPNYSRTQYEKRICPQCGKEFEIIISDKKYVVLMNVLIDIM